LNKHLDKSKANAADKILLLLSFYLSTAKWPQTIKNTQKHNPVAQ
jgi:hypothetical protein